MKLYKVVDKLEPQECAVVMAENKQEALKKLYADIHGEDPQTWTQGRENDQDYLNQLFSENNYTVEELNEVNYFKLQEIE